jgi:hypothetical protein
MKWLISSLILSSFAFADDIKSLPNQAGNGNIDLAGTAILDAKEIEQVVGAPMDQGYIVVRIKVTPRTLGPLRISADDFTLVSRKDGERSDALASGQIGGQANLILKSKTTHSSIGVSNTTVNVTPVDGKSEPESPLQKLVAAKMLPDKETKEPVEGLLYFLLEGKNKVKDLGLIYKGPAGRLAMDFK